MIHATLDSALQKTGEAFIVLQPEGGEVIFDRFPEAELNRHEKTRAPLTEEAKKALTERLQAGRRKKKDAEQAEDAKIAAQYEKDFAPKAAVQ